MHSQIGGALVAAMLTITTVSALAGTDDGKNDPDLNEPAATAPYTSSLIVAGGCFWCVESDFEKLDGVGDVISGYSGGNLDKPTYRNHGRHLEVALVPYDASVISYRELVDYFFRHVDPTDADGQFCDRGHSYTTAVFYSNEDEEQAAGASKAAAQQELNEDVVTPILARKTFWRAEEYHQDYYKKNSIRYKYYRTSCGRDRRVKKLWKK